MNPASRSPGRNLWPGAIIAAFAVFVLATAGLVVFSTFHRDELVTANYYEQELRYQEQIERQERTQPWLESVHIAYVPALRQIQIALPPQHARLRPAGHIQLYRPAAAGQDRDIALDLDRAGRQSLDARGLSEGLWRVRIRWTADGEDYGIEERLVIHGMP